jgi:hypothetical protein
MEKETSASKYGRYRSNLRRVFSEVNIQGYGKVEEVKRVLDLAKRYYDDAAHFKDKGEIETALISLAYSEGLLDGLRLMGHIQFKWREEV